MHTKIMQITADSVTNLCTACGINCESCLIAGDANCLSCVVGTHNNTAVSPYRCNFYLILLMWVNIFNFLRYQIINLKNRL